MMDSLLQVCKITEIHILKSGDSLVVQQLRLCVFTAKGMGSISGWETKIPEAARHGVHPSPQKRVKIGTREKHFWVFFHKSMNHGSMLSEKWGSSSSEVLGVKREVKVSR